MTNNNSEVTAVERFFEASGPMATSLLECNSRRYEECLKSNRGAVTVWLASGKVERIAGTRYLEVERLRGEEVDGVLEVLYLGEVLRSYADGTWTRWQQVEGADPFTS
ncbi:hypothetical protein ACTWP6_23655 [Mycobacterium sp. 4D054]|uniref:hypothetical protein n=1 Tax=Mycobacterium sp. 4D054 TaxID=3457440 RepID=UPI003FD6AD0A